MPDKMDRTQQPPISELEELDLQKPVRTVLPNGIPLSVINSGEQEVCRIDLVFEAGQLRQNTLLQALFTNRMLREGTVRYTSAEIASKFDYYGAWLELTCSMEHAIVTLYTLNRYCRETLSVLHSMVTEPVFPEKEFATVVDMNLQRLQVNLANVEYLSQRSLLGSLFGESHPYGKFAKEEDYRNLTTEHLKSFYDKYYTSDNCHIFLAGKITPAVMDAVTDVMGTKPFGSNKADLTRPCFEIQSVPQKRIFTEKSDAVQSSLRMGAVTIDHNHEDYLKLRVLITLFGGYFGSRLMTNIREEKGYTYGISAGLMSYPDTSVLMINSESDNEYVEAVVREVYAEIDRLHTEPVSEQELTMVKNYMIGEMCRSYESAFALQDGWIFIYVSKLDDDYFRRSLRAVKEATPQDMARLARQYLCKETLKEVVAGKKMS